ncbi:hypothetical protein BJX62DRAFT_241906 [Aspergillus germanicus]
MIITTWRSRGPCQVLPLFIKRATHSNSTTHLGRSSPQQELNPTPNFGMQSVLHPILGPKKEIHDLTGRVALVTGGALGIGYEITRAFALNRARVIMTSRKEEQGDAAIKQIKEESGHKAKIEWVHCDSGNFNEIKSVLSVIREREQRLDLLILDAGINANQYTTTHDEIERLFQVNWLGNFSIS